MSGLPRRNLNRYKPLTRTGEIVCACGSPNFTASADKEFVLLCADCGAVMDREFTSEDGDRIVIDGETYASECLSWTED